MKLILILLKKKLFNIYISKIERRCCKLKFKNIFCFFKNNNVLSNLSIFNDSLMLNPPFISIYY